MLNIYNFFSNLNSFLFFYKLIYKHIYTPLSNSEFYKLKILIKKTPVGEKNLKEQNNVSFIMQSLLTKQSTT